MSIIIGPTCIIFIIIIIISSSNSVIIISIIIIISSSSSSSSSTQRSSRLVGSFRVAQATRKHDYIQALLRILYRVLFGMAGASFPHTYGRMAYSIHAVGVGLR